jgi:hypothetical protein
MGVEGEGDVNFFPFIGIVYQGKDIVFRFIIEYSSLNGFWLLGNSSIFI